MKSVDIMIFCRIIDASCSFIVSFVDVFLSRVEEVTPLRRRRGDSDDLEALLRFGLYLLVKSCSD